LSRSRYIPSAYPYTVIANKAGTKAWVSLWNDSAVAELNLEAGKVARWIPLGPAEPSRHPTQMLLNPNEDTLYVAQANADVVAAVDLKAGSAPLLYFTNIKDHGSVHRRSRSRPTASISMLPALLSTRSLCSKPRE